MADLHKSEHEQLATAYAPQRDIKQQEDKLKSYPANENNGYAPRSANSFSYSMNRFDRHTDSRFGSSLVSR